jgi:hypothetical protein
MTKEKLYTIVCNRRQLELISRACDLVSRLQCCQFDHIANIVQPSYWGVEHKYFTRLHAFQEDLLKLKSYFNLTPNSSYGIHSLEVQDSARTLYDMHQVVRNKIAYEDSPGVTPQNRWKMHKFQVNYDEPHQSDKENELIKVE